MHNTSTFAPEKRKEKVSLLVFHCFALSAKKMLEIMQQTGTGAHYIIQRNGKIINLTAENMVAYHAGISSWREFSGGINARSIGIELQNSAMGNAQYTKAQIASLSFLAKEIIQRHEIKAQNIVGHSDIAPFRKPDPGIYFPWEVLAKSGIGIWPKLNENAFSNAPLDREEITELLQKIGYNTTDLSAALYAFCARFIPQKISVQKDIIKKEEQVFAYWQKFKADEIADKISSAPKIYPKSAQDLFADTKVHARLKTIAEMYGN